LELVIVFLVAAAISFVGSVLLGLVNVAVIDTAIRKSSKSAIWLAFGGVLPEIPYTMIPLLFASSVMKYEGLKNYMGLVGGAIFIAIGLFYIFKKSKKKDAQKDGINETGALNHFLKGFLLALSNPQLIFFWATVIVALESFLDTKGLDALDSHLAYKLSFSLGAAFGAFAILLIYIKLANRFKESLLGLIGDKLTSWVGVVFVVLGTFTILKNVF
jgi:threonine/homoserine/homoserine lactone efflux protein